MKATAKPTNRPNHKRSEGRQRVVAGKQSFERSAQGMKREERELTSSRKQTSKKSTSVLANCPVSGAGWCPYPFSLKQLEKRMKAKAAMESAKLAIIKATRSPTTV